MKQQELQKIKLEMAQEIYNYIFNISYSKAPKDVAFRYHYGSKGVIDNILEWIWYNYIEDKKNI